jgi:adenosylcobyric acid synthase
MSCDGNVFGTYLHGIFDNESFLKGLVSLIYRRKGIEKDVDINPVTEEFKYNELARIVRESVDIQEIYRIMGL